MATSSHPDDIYAQFAQEVNMSAAELEKWLDTDESKAVGQKDDGARESIGHKSGKHIVEILRKKKADLTPDDEAHMHKVHSYISRHKAQGPHKSEDVPESAWRYSLMNWGHDPLKDKK